MTEGAIIGLRAVQVIDHGERSTPLRIQDHPNRTSFGSTILNSGSTFAKTMKS